MGVLLWLLRVVFLALLGRGLYFLVRELFGGREEGPSAQRGMSPRMRYVVHLMRLLAKLAKADGRVTEREIAGVERIFRELGLTPPERAMAQEAFRDGKLHPDAWVAVAREMAMMVGDFELRVLTFQYMARLACADGVLSPEEQEVLLGTAQMFGISPQLVMMILAQLGARFEGAGGGRSGGGWRGRARPPEMGQRERDLALLGLPATATAEEVAKAYRRKVKELHPDRLQAQGMPERMLKEASDRMAEINAAYERLKR